MLFRFPTVAVLGVAVKDRILSEAGTTNPSNPREKLVTGEP